ncbi:twin-arginine translocation signal domain-containing protein [Haloarchaeobius sp. HME9146]|uniref:twin-arginine translocation signal domain-containing protein n=1 Tax=Haloarchaeobius sp. HME9146 TaxID=2978732 RepID=UPI0021C0A3BF|nr:twin-arginine translocation signal domain-containing protein [Haloarchaeobius sp. HME9146]MCT9094881.1 twin-arginine translocation signal domain-containing protein [Haloarchaeobius sp. HME9146]
MTDENDPHCRHGQETQQNRANTTSESRVSRRDLLKGSGGAAAATVIPFEGLTTKANSPLGLNNNGAPVVVVQGTPNNPVGAQRRRNITDRVHEEAIDRGREPPRVKGGIKRADQKTNPTVAYVSTVTDDGVPRQYYGLAENDPSSAHGSAMARAKLLAEKNGSEIEVHKPNGRVDTMRPNGVGKAGRVTPISNESLQRYAAELEVSPSRRGYDASRSMGGVYSQDMGSPFYHSEVDEEDPDWGAATLYIWRYHVDSGGKYDPYQIQTRLWQKCGHAQDRDNPGAGYDEDWKNNYSKVDHLWNKELSGEDNLTIHELGEVDPKNDGETVTTSEEVSVSLSDITYTTSKTKYISDGVDVDIRRSRLDDGGWVKWISDFVHEDLRRDDYECHVASGASQEALDCSKPYEYMMLTRNEAAFIEDPSDDDYGYGTDTNNDRNSIYMNWYLAAWCQ